MTGVSDPKGQSVGSLFHSAGTTIPYTAVRFKRRSILLRSFFDPDTTRIVCGSPKSGGVSRIRGIFGKLILRVDLSRHLKWRDINDWWGFPSYVAISSKEIPLALVTFLLLLGDLEALFGVLSNAKDSELGK